MVSNVWNAPGLCLFLLEFFLHSNSYLALKVDTWYLTSPPLGQTRTSSYQLKVWLCSRSCPAPSVLTLVNLKCIIMMSTREVQTLRWCFSKNSHDKSANQSRICHWWSLQQFSWDTKDSADSVMCFLFWRGWESQVCYYKRETSLDLEGSFMSYTSLELSL